MPPCISCIHNDANKQQYIEKAKLEAKAKGLTALVITTAKNTGYMWRPIGHSDFAHRTDIEYYTVD